ncbi:EAL domain-containing protein [Devosia sp. FKR38]|uniref:EAL domain-containing protein n=1 Tax=Devosia sp. FKR38 TaxID=2562312 RepID=UPI0010BFF049|nr:EAL domain-containing protein [Devosia sp. FKR38]
MAVTVADRGHRAVLSTLIVATSALGFSWAGWAGLENLQTQRNLSQLDELSGQLLQRAELAVDYAVITLGDYAAPSNDLCNADALRALRQATFARGAIKEIAVLAADGQLLCSTTPGHFDTQSSSAQVAEFESRNPSIVLQPSHAEGSGLFRVLWRVGDSHSIAATLNIDMLMFDTFPAPLRDEALAEIRVGPADVIARFGDVASTGPVETTRVFASASGRYPVNVALAVSDRSFRNWNPWPQVPVLAIGAMAGALIGLLAAQSLMRPPGPVDALRLAIRRGELVPYYQPIFELATSQIIGCEVLVRWLKRDGEVVFPDRFISTAEASGLIAPMTERLVERALIEMKPMLADRPEFKIAFNIDPAHFVTPGFLDTLDHIVANAGSSAGHVVLELTERNAYPDMKLAVAVSDEARKRGYRVSLDDTGAGHNGLGHIQDLNPDIIKIDKKFVDVFGVVATADAIVEVLVSLGNRIGAVLVAEGIETEGQRAALADAGVAQGQGYLVSKPVPVAAFLTMLQEREVSALPPAHRYAEVA